jgi:hypothetical protein
MTGMPSIDQMTFWLLLCLIVSTITIAGLIGIWAALARLHWFLRAAVIIAVLSLLAMVPAYDLVIVLLVEIGCVVVPLAIWRFWRSRRDENAQVLAAGRWHYRLSDLLLLTVVAAVAAWLVKNLPNAVRETIATYVIWGAAGGFAVLIGWFSAQCLRRWWLSALLVGALPPVIAILPANTSPVSEDMLPVSTFLSDLECPDWSWYPALIASASVVAIWLILFRRAGIAASLPATSTPPSVNPPRARRIIAARFAFVTVSIAILVLPAIAYFQMITPPPPPLVELPSPNAYVELQRIGAELASRNPPDVDTASESSLRKFVADNGETFDAVRDALTNEAMVPVNYAAGDMAFFPEMSSIRGLWQGLLVERRVAELDGRYDDACDDCLALVQVGAKSGRGGLLIYLLVSLAPIGRGLSGIRALRSDLSPAKLRETYTALQSFEATLDPAEQIVKRDRIWEQYHGWPSRIRFLRPAADTRHYDWLQQYWLASFHLLECGLAVRLFHHERGRWPDRLDELVPDYFALLPPDPYTGRQLIYRRQPDGFVLYSTGPDQIDNGGVHTTTGAMIPTGEDLPLAEPKAGS